MKLGVIGFGNMGSAIIDGFLFKNVLNPNDIFCYSRDYEKLLINTSNRKVNACRNISEVIKNSDLIIISTPANIFNDIINEIKDYIGEKIVFSVCSGGTYKTIEAIAPKMHFIQGIPSTPIRYGEGIICFEDKNLLTLEELDIVINLFNKIALVKFFNENEIDIASTISGCGPSFAAIFIETLGDAGCKYGLSREDSYSLASKMLIGVGTSYLESKKHPSILKDEVASPGGTTILGITKLEECGFRNSIIKAIDAISKREK